MGNKGSRHQKLESSNNNINSGVINAQENDYTTGIVKPKAQRISIEKESSEKFGRYFIEDFYKIIFERTGQAARRAGATSWLKFQDGSFVVDDPEGILFQMLSRGYFDTDNTYQMTNNPNNLSDFHQIESPGNIPLTHLMTFYGIRKDKRQKSQMVYSIHNRCFNELYSCDSALIQFHNPGEQDNAYVTLQIGHIAGTTNAFQMTKNSQVKMFEREFENDKYVIDIKDSTGSKLNYIKKAKDVIKFYSFSIIYKKGTTTLENKRYTFVKFESGSVGKNLLRHLKQNLKKKIGNQNIESFPDGYAEKQGVACTTKPVTNTEKQVTTKTQGRKYTQLTSNSNSNNNYAVSQYSPCYRCEDVCPRPDDSLYDTWKGVYNRDEDDAYKTYRTGQEFFVSTALRNSIIGNVMRRRTILRSRENRNNAPINFYAGNAVPKDFNAEEEIMLGGKKKRRKRTRKKLRGGHHEALLLTAAAISKLLKTNKKRKTRKRKKK